MSIRMLIVLSAVALAAVLGAPAVGRADDCVGGCAGDGRACLGGVKVDGLACRAACAAAPDEDAGACRATCRASARAARRSCRADFAACAQTCTGSCAVCGLDLASCAGSLVGSLRTCAAGCAGDATCLDGCAGAAASDRAACRDGFAACQAGCGGARATGGGASAIEIIPPGAVSAIPGQTVYLTFTVVNHGPSGTFHYKPSFIVSGGASVRSVSGAPSSSGQALSHNARKAIKVGVRVDSSAPGGGISVVGVFAFTAPETFTLSATGTISVHGFPSIAATCRTQLVGDHSVRVTVDVENQGTEVVKAVRATRELQQNSGGARFTVTSGRSPSVVFRLDPGRHTQITFGGGWNKRGVLRIFEGATATTKLNRPIASDVVECFPPLVGR